MAEADALESPGARMAALDALLKAHAAAKHAGMVQMYADSLLTLCGEEGMPAVALAAAFNTAAFFTEQEQPKRSLAYLERGLALARTEDNWAWQAAMLEKMGLAQYMLQVWDASAAHSRGSVGTHSRYGW